MRGLPGSASLARMGQGRSRIEIFVFSYNRGTRLDWCLDSIARHARGVPVTVMDDRSTDPAVAETLSRRGLPVWQPDVRTDARLGGLYSNMQAAFDRAEAPLIMFVQDDCQMVRTLDAPAMADLDAIFADEDQLAVSALFPMGPRQASRRHQYRPIAAGAAFHLVPPEGKGSITAQYFYALSILHRSRLRQRGWRFEGSEGASARRIAELGGARLAHMARPLLAQLPEVPTSRFGRRTLGARLAERLDGPELRGFRDGPADLPVGPAPPLAEDWLTPTHPGTTRPYIHKAVNRRPLTRLLNGLELRLGRFGR